MTRSGAVHSHSRQNGSFSKKSRLIQLRLILMVLKVCRMNKYQYEQIPIHFPKKIHKRIYIVINNAVCRKTHRPGGQFHPPIALTTLTLILCILQKKCVNYRSFSPVDGDTVLYIIKQHFFLGAMSSFPSYHGPA